ncbi:MAG: sigma-E processing peptidase SpoIIGA [Lachnospiraceae bacterium]|nr:sigma-E processing peptidase SpoIIGA [Lachnospiraceae bacterium]
MLRSIYIDRVFLNNFVMDLFLITLTVKTLKKTATFFRILTGSLLGAAGYCLILCLPGIPYFLKVIFGMVPVAMGMIKLGCRTKGLKELLYGLGYLFTYSFFTGGFMLFLIRRVPFLKSHKDSFLLILLTGYVSFSFCVWGLNKYKKSRQNHFCRVELEGDDESILVCGLIDTGNGLTEPLSGKPVAILEEEVWKKMNGLKKPEKYKIIPYHSIGKENGILEGYEIEKIRIEYETGTRELAHVLIAVFNGKLSVKGEYQMILPPQWAS